MLRLLLVAGACCLATNTHADSHSLLLGEVTVCPATAGDDSPPTFTEAGCRRLPGSEVDPQGRQLWVRGNVATPRGAKHTAVGLFISGKMSSRAYLNGVLLGENGKPGASRVDEQPGRIDAVLFVPPDVLREGANELVLKLSAQRSRLTLEKPVHQLQLGAYASPRDLRLQSYWPSLVPLGALLLGALYWVVFKASRGSGVGSMTLALMSLFAALQVFAEISRGVLSYPYPWHDIRLLAILLFAGAFGLSLVAHVCDRLGLERKALWLVATGLLTFGAVLLEAGYDNKTAAALLVTSLAGLALSVTGIRRGVPSSARFAVALGVFASILWAAPMRFLDLYFSFVVAGLVAFLTAQQARALALEQRRGQRLEAALDRRGETPGTLRLSSAGKTEVIGTDRIEYCKGARDYVEIALEDGTTRLHNTSLAQLEDELPSAFLRVHRSYLVNTGRVSTLVRERNGVGRLVLASGVEVPVSRRIMSTVRKALS